MVRNALYHLAQAIAAVDVGAESEIQAPKAGSAQGYNTASTYSVNLIAAGNHGGIRFERDGFVQVVTQSASQHEFGNTGFRVVVACYCSGKMVGVATAESAAPEPHCRSHKIHGLKQSAGFQQDETVSNRFVFPGRSSEPRRNDQQDGRIRWKAPGGVPRIREQTLHA